MPIAVQEIVNRAKAKLDAEGSERYLFDQDFKPAINEAMEILITSLNQAFAEKKLSHECLRELVKVYVWQANQFSRVAYNEVDTGHPKWTIIGVYPKIKANKNVSGSSTSDPSESKFRADVTFISSEKAAKRLTLEEWNQNFDNAFMPGNNVLAGSLVEYAYLDEADYTSTSYGVNNQIEFTVRPAIPGQLVALAYLKYPNQVSLISDNIEFPQSLTNLITEIVLFNISYKQGDQTNLASLTAGLTQRLINLLK